MATRPWERQENEGSEAWEAFVAYREMSPSDRAYARVAEKLGKSQSHIERWGAKHQWMARVRAWEDAQDRIWQDVVLGERRRAAKRHMQMAQLALSKVGQALIDLDESRMSPAELTRLLEAAVKIERDAMGVAAKTEITGKDGGPIEVANMTPEERKEWLLQAQREISRRLEENGEMEEPGEGKTFEP